MKAADKGGLNLLRWNAVDIRLASVELADLCGINIETGDAETSLTEKHGERKANVSHADNANLEFATFDAEVPVLWL